MSSNDPIDPRDIDPLDEEPVAAAEVMGAAAVAGTPADLFRPAGVDSQDEPEVDIWEGAYCGKAMIGKWISAGILSLVAVVSMLKVKSLGENWKIVLLVLGVLWVGLALMFLYRKISVRYQLTTQRFMHRSGILTRVSDRIEVIDIDDVTYHQGLIERLFDVGSIQLVSSDKTHPELWLRGIANVKQVANQIDDLRRQERRRRGLHIESI